MRLRSHLVTLVVGAMAPVLVFSAVMVFLFSHQERAAVERGMRETARALVVAIDREVEASVIAMEALATARPIDTGNIAEFHDQATRVAASREAWQSIALVSPSGQQLFDTLTPYGTELPPASDREYFRRVVETRRTAVSDLVGGRIANEPVLVVAVPVRRDGRLLYVLLAALDARTLERILQQQQLPDGWLATVIDRQKVIVARTRNSERFVGQPAAAGLAARSAEQDEGWFRDSIPEGPRVYLAFSRSALTGWTVALGIPVSVIEGSLHRSLVGVAAAGVLFLLLGAALAMRFGSWIAYAISKLTGSAEMLGRGQEPPALRSGVSEVSEVARALQHASALLRQQSLERENAAAAARESEERLRFALDAAQVGTWEWNIEAGRITWSPNLESIHGLAPGSFPGTFEAYQQEIHPDDREHVLEGLRRAREEGVDHDVEYRIVRRDGTIRWLHGRGRLARDTGGRPVRMSGVCIDVTARKRAEEERAALLTLEQEARAEAEQLNRAKDEFLATLSHELRTPLNAIMGWARLLTSDEAAAPRAREVIERNTKVLAQLVGDLLDVSRIITGKVRLDTRPLAPAPVLEAAIDAVRAAAAAKQIRIHAALDASMGEILADPNRLQQIVWNLLSNAVKFTPAGGQIDVRLRRAETHVEIVIADTGKGISPDFLPYVFDRFRQADSTASRPQGGLGLGLAIVRHLVELHGGTVHADSGGDGRGATFTVRLPLVEPATAGARAPTSTDTETGEGDADRRPSLDGVRVLLVEDEDDSRELMATVLQTCGAHVTAVASAGEAVMTLDLTQPDVLVSDIGMPGEDGYALIRKIRTRNSQGRPLPAVALTAHAREEDRSRALAAGYQVHVSKPVDPATLARTVAVLAGRIHAD